VLAAIGRRPRLAAAAGVSVAWAGVATWLATDFSGRITDWSVMSDEMLYTKLAVSIADTGSPLPQIHDTHVEVLNQLYPLLIAPLFVGTDFVTAFRATHVLNAVLMSSACIPAYLIARQVVTRFWSLAVAVVSVTVPWMVLTGVLMTESAAYPAFLWAVLCCVHAIRRPGRRGDLLAVGGLVLAVLARTQFVAVAVVLPVAILADAFAESTARPLRRRVAEAASSAVRDHKLLTCAYLVTGAVAAAVAVSGSIGDALGVYSSTLHGSILPSSVWQASAAHLDAVAIGCGLVPLILGGGWMLAEATDFRRDRADRHFGFAIFSLLAIAVLAVETASFDIRFGGQIVRDRYLFYVVPLLLTGMAKALSASGGADRTRVAIGAAALTAFFVGTVHWLDFPIEIAYWVDSPERILNGTIADQSGSLSTAAFAALAGGLLGTVLVIALVVVHRRILAVAVVAFLLPFTVLTTRAEIDTVVAGKSSSGRRVAGPSRTLNWVDSVLPGGPSAAMIPFPESPEFPLDAVRWWDLEFWNRTVAQTLVAADGNFSYAPFPDQTLAPDWSSGTIRPVGRQPPFVVFAPDDSRLRLAGVRHAEKRGFSVILADRPYRLDWMTRGLDIDGWDRDGRQATVRVYSHLDRPERVDVAIALAAPQDAPARYAVLAGRTQRTGLVTTAESTATETVTLCVPANSHSDVELTSSSEAFVPDPPLSFSVSGARHVGVRVGPIETTRTGRSCDGTAAG
jgi:hypothetical protein